MTASPLLRDRQNPAYRSLFPLFLETGFRAHNPTRTVNRAPATTEGKESNVQHAKTPPGSFLSLTSAVLLFLCALAFTVAAQSPEELVHPTPVKRLLNIYISGNYRTQEDVVKLYLGLDSGMVYDSTIGAQARERLERTQLFAKVVLLTIDKPEGLHLYVVLTENGYFSLTDASGEIQSRRYGEVSPPLLKSWSASLGLKFDNLRGRMESLRVFVRFWEWRALALSWHKPFLPTNWFLTISNSISSGPEEIRARHSRTLSAGFTAGRTWPKRKLRASLSTTPRYQTSTYKGPDDPGVYHEETRPFFSGDNMPAATMPEPSRRHDTSWTRTEPVGTDSVRYQYWRGNRLWEPNQSQEAFFETFTSLAGQIDKTNNSYPKSRGWLLWGRLGYNLPIQFSHDVATSDFFQFDIEARFYHHLFTRSDSWAHRLRLTLRDSPGGISHVVTAGSETSLRGYASASLGVRSQANNRLLFTTEYRFPLFRTPSMPVPAIAGIYTPLRDLYYRFDGALFADLALVWQNWNENPFVKQGPAPHREAGTGMGIGIRMVSPQLKRNVCFDIAPIIWDSALERPRLYYPLHKQLGYKPVLPWHLYIDFTF